MKALNNCNNINDRLNSEFFKVIIGEEERWCLLCSIPLREPKVRVKQQL